ncbi:MAG: four helix bundle protein [Bacteroidota bacterium]
MAKLERFEDLEAWKIARELANDIFTLSSAGEISKDFSLKDQMRRSSGSIMDNIAEGFGRGGNKEFIRFLFISKGSISELQSQLYRALDRGYLSKEEFNSTYKKADRIAKIVHGLIKYLKNSELRGKKYS